LQNEIDNLKKILKEKEELYKDKLSHLLKENNNFKKSLDIINNENQKYKNENSKLIEKNNSLNLKIQRILNY